MENFNLCLDIGVFNPLKRVKFADCNSATNINGKLFQFLSLMCSKGVYILSFSYLTSYDSASLDLISNYKTSREARCKTGWPVSRCTQFPPMRV